MAGKKFSIEAVFAAIDKISAPIGKIRTKLGSLGKGARSALTGASKAVDQGMAGIGKFSNAIGVGAAVSVAGLGLALRDTIQEGANFERTMVFAAAQFPGMIKQGTKEFDALALAAKTVGDQTEFSAQDAAEGLTLLATAGLSAEQAIAALPKVVNFATASKVEFAKASDIANDAMGAFGLKSKDAATNAANMSRVMDVLTRAAADSTTNVEELFEAVATGGPIAKTAGTGLETFIGFTEVLAGTGIKGAEAGTAIRNMFLELGAPSTAAAKGMGKLGVKVAKTKEGAIDMTATIGRFAKATEKMTKAQKIQALGSVFGARTVGPFISLMEAGTGTIEEFEKALQNASGTTEGMAKELSADTLGALRQFDSLISGIKLDVFEAIRPVMLDLVKATSDWVTANRDLIKTKAAEWIVMLRDHLPEIWTWTVRIAKAFAAFGAFALTVKALEVAIAGYEVATKLAEGVTYLWGLAMKVVNSDLVRSAIFTAGQTAANVAGRLATIATTAATWLYQAAVAFANLAQKRFTISQVASRAAQVAGQLVMAAITGVQWLYNAAVGAGSAAMGSFNLAQVASKVAQIASQGVTVAITAITWLYNAAIGAGSAALGIFSGVTWGTVPALIAQAAAAAPLLVTFGALAAAVAGVVVLYQQLTQLSAELAGSGGITGTIGKMIEMGTFDPFAAHDAAMNEKAKEEARQRAAGAAPQVVSPQARAAAENAEANASANVSGTITVASAPGTKASVTTKPNGVPIQLARSGAFP